MSLHSFSQTWRDGIGKLREHVQCREIVAHVFLFDFGGGKEQPAAVEGGRPGFKVAMAGPISFHRQIVFIRPEEFTEGGVYPPIQRCRKVCAFRSMIVNSQRKSLAKAWIGQSAPLLWLRL